MRYFKDEQGGIHGFEESDHAQVELMNQLTSGWLDITASCPPSPSVSELQQQLQSHALSALYKTDKVAFRCFKAGIPFPEDWQHYTHALRAIVNGSDTSSTSLPEQPDYPDGT